MSYASLIKQLYEVNVHGGMKLGLRNCERLDQALGFPSKAFPSIHVAGTNGKGSVTTKIASAFEHLGLKVGLYTSPHLSCFRERIKINEKIISEKDIENLLPSLFRIGEEEKIPSTFFELVTLLAFSYFAKEKVDIAVLETGLGGRLDATNIVTPQLTAITSISLEHTDILGNSIEKIAEEKAGIIKPRIPLVIGPRVPFEVIQPIAERNRSPLYQVLGNFLTFEQENRAIAKRCLEVLNVPLEAIEKGISVTPKCRLELVSNHLSRTIILDVGHNPDGLTHLMKSINIQYPNKPLKIICGLSRTKDISSCIQILKSHASHIYPVTAPNGRGLPTKELYESLIRAGISSSSITLLSSITESVKHALTSGSEEEILLICGSFFIMSEARQALGIEEPRDLIDINERM